MNLPFPPHPTQDLRVLYTASGACKSRLVRRFLFKGQELETTERPPPGGGHPTVVIEAAYASIRCDRVRQSAVDPQTSGDLLVAVAPIPL